MTDTKLVIDANVLTAISLKKVDAPTKYVLPSAEEIAIAKKLAEEEPEPIPKEFLPKTGNGQTHLDLIKGGIPTLKKVETIKEPTLPSVEQLAAEKAAEAVSIYTIVMCIHISIDSFLN
jgi:hypothetical protein